MALFAIVLAGLLSGLGPALRTSQVQPQAALKDRSPRSGRRSRLRDVMVVAQLAIALTLLVGATLLGQSLLRLLRVDPGFNYENVLTISLRPAGNPIQFYERLTAPVFYLSMHGIIYGSMHLVVRSDQNVAALLPSIRPVVNEIDLTIPLFRTRTLEQLRATNLGQND